MARLERTDKPVSVLLEELGEGALGLPEIQRSYVWNRPQARDLVDSLYREYPSGLILLWKPKELPMLRNMAADQKADKIPDLLVLDGQQRLTSLKRIFTGEINVYFNVEDESFQLYSSNLKADPLWVPVTKVVNEGAAKAWKTMKSSLQSKMIQIAEQNVDEYLERLSALEKIKDYRYPVMIIHTDDYEEITESFIRVNSKGTRLRDAELAMAKLAFHWPGAMVTQFAGALDTYEDAGFDLEARFLMRCYVATSTGQSRFRFLGELWKRSQEDLEGIWERTRKGVDYAINFLKNNAGIESSYWIPSVNALVPLVAYLSLKDGHLSDDEARSLLLWFFVATIHGRFSGSPETKIDQDLKAILSPTPFPGLFSNLRRQIATFEVTPEMIEGKYQGHSFLPLIFAIARKKGAKDWFTGTTLSSTNVGSEHQLELHHVFPRGQLIDTHQFKTQEIDDIANIAFLSQKANRAILASRPKDYLAKIESERLVSQNMPMDQSLWEVERFRDFLAERRKLLVGAMNKYLQELGSETAESIAIVAAIQDQPDGPKRLYGLASPIPETVQPVAPANVLAEIHAVGEDEEDRPTPELKQRHVLRKEFWSMFFGRATERGIAALSGRKPSIYYYVAFPSGKVGVNFDFFVHINEPPEIDVYIDTHEKEKNKRWYDQLYSNKEAIESDFGGPLIWERLDNARASRILCKVRGFGLKDGTDKWPVSQDAMIDAMIRLSKATMPRILALAD
jgi:hypothetical protein